MMQIFLLSLPAPHAHGLTVSYDRVFSTVRTQKRASTLKITAEVDAYF